LPKFAGDLSKTYKIYHASLRGGKIKRRLTLSFGDGPFRARPKGQSHSGTRRAYGFPF